MRTGTAHLPLHGGRAPRWLFQRMVRLAREILRHLVAEHGPEGTLARLANPYWFQALGCVLGFDWHSSGVTTTATGALKEALRGLEGELGLWAAGGKGAAGRRTPEEIRAACERLGRDPAPLVRASRLAAQVDGAALQDGYRIYHHAFFLTASGHWCVVQQGMDETEGMARRYHWLSRRVRRFAQDPHTAVCCDRRGRVALNLATAESAPAQEALVAIASQPDREVRRALDRLPELALPRRHDLRLTDLDRRRLGSILLRTYERPPRDFEELLLTPTLGPKALRALALVAELVHGTPASTRDPARYAFAHGGKDRTPYPVDRRVYDHTIEALRQALGGAVARARGLEPGERRAALRRLAAFARRAGPGPADGPL